MSKDMEWRHQRLRIAELEKEQREMFALLSAMVASAGEQGITITLESRMKDYEVTRFENPESSTITFTAKEKP